VAGCKDRLKLQAGCTSLELRHGCGKVSQNFEILHHVLPKKKGSKEQELNGFKQVAP
jgi:hypothetical protein